MFSLANAHRTRARLGQGLIVAALLLAGLPASAVVIAGGGTNAAPLNDTAPVSDPGWDRVGVVGNGTGVYLGNGYVLTANHVSPKTSLIIDGQTFNRLSTDTGTTLTNSPGLTATTDLHLFRVAVPEGSILHGLDPLAISSSPLAGTGQLGTFIGTGRTQEEQARVSFGNGNFGFNVGDAATRDKRWAILDAGVGETINVFTRDVVAFRSSFDNALNDGMAAASDSGSPVFFNPGSGFELGGIVFAIGTYNGQPADTAWFGNVTFVADLAAYRDQLLVYNGDLTGDQLVDEADLDLVLSRFGRSVQAGHYELGDGTGDGRVDVRDLNLVLSNWSGAGPPPSLEFALASIPEPGTAGLLALGGLLLGRRRR